MLCLFFQLYSLITLVVISLILQFIVALAFTSSTEKDYKPPKKKPTESKPNKKPKSQTVGGIPAEVQEPDTVMNDLPPQPPVTITLDDLKEENPFKYDRSNPKVRKVAYICTVIIFLLNCLIQFLDQIWMP